MKTIFPKATIFNKSFLNLFVSSTPPFGFFRALLFGFPLAYPFVPGLVFILCGMLGCVKEIPLAEKAKPSFIKVYATQPGAPSRGVAIESAIVEAIDGAQERVEMAFYNFRSRPIAEALRRAKARGVDVGLVGDLGEFEAGAYHELTRRALPLVPGNRSGIQHNKFLIVDAALVICGTGNFTHTGIYHNDNHYLKITAPQIVEAYRREFKQMAGGRFSQTKTTSGVFTNDPPIELYFSPQEGEKAIERMIQLIDAAGETIHYMVFAFSHDEIASALLRASRRGVAVYGIHDSGFVKGASQEAERLYRAAQYGPGPAIRFDGNEELYQGEGYSGGSKMHCKTMLIDIDTPGRSVITGSFNWSANAVNSNDENLLIFREEQAARQVYGQWLRAWRLSKSLGPFFVKEGGTALTPSGSAEMGADQLYISEIGWGGLVLPNGPSPSDDFIELVNAGNKTIDLQWYTISWRGPHGLLTYTIDDPLRLAPGERALFYSSDSSFTKTPAKEMVDPAALRLPIPASKKFDLGSETQFEVYLYDPTMRLIDSSGEVVGPPAGFFDFSAPNSRAASAERLFVVNDPDAPIPNYSAARWTHTLTQATDSQNYISPGGPEPLRLASPCASFQSYKAKAAGSALFLGSPLRPNLYLLQLAPAAKGLYPLLPFQKTPILDITTNPANGDLYIATPKAIFVSSDNALSFATLPGIPQAEGQAQVARRAIRDMAAGESFFYIIEDQLYRAQLEGALWQPAQLNTLGRPLFIEAYSTPGGFALLLLSDAGFFTSSDDGASFTPLFLGALPFEAAAVRGLKVRLKPSAEPNNLGVQILTHTADLGYLIDSIIGNSAATTVTTLSPPREGESIESLGFVESVEVGQGALYGATPFGIYEVANGAWSPLYEFEPCPAEGGQNQTAAQVELYSVYPAAPNRSARFLLLAKTAGSLEGTLLEEVALTTQLIYRLPPLPVEAGELIEIELMAPPEFSSWVEESSSQIRYRFYAPYKNPPLGDAIIQIRQEGAIADFIYMTNRDGLVSSNLMNGAFREIYHNPAYPPFFNGAPFPVDEWNDHLIQSLGVDISRISGQYFLQKGEFGEELWEVKPDN